MIRKLFVAFVLFVFFSSNAFAFAGSFSSYEHTRNTGSVAGAVQIKGKGIYTLIVTIEFLRKPQDSKIYKSDEYEKFMDRLLIESRGIALKKILESKELAVSDLNDLRKSMETDINNMAAALKNKLMPDQNIEVVFSIPYFYLLEPHEK